jgi:hypothetical protein
MTVEFKKNSVTEHSDNFILGLAFLKKQLLTQALRNFQLAYDEVPYGDIYHNKYASYCGLTRVLNGDRAGVELCRDAARQEMIDGDVFLNLAYSEWHMKSRKRSVGILKKGLKIDAKHAGLNKFESFIGRRSRPIIFFISRDNFLNKTLGKMVRKNSLSTDNWNFRQFI